MKDSSTLIGEGNNTWKDFLSSREVEELLECSRDTLDRYCMDGKITYFKPNRGKRLFLRKDIYNFILKTVHYSKEDLIKQASEKRLKTAYTTI